MAEKCINKVVLMGRLGKDAETKYTPLGRAVSNFSLATSHRWKDSSGEWKDATSWHKVVLWGGENVAQYLLKGTRIYIEGRSETRMWEDKEGKKNYTTEAVCQASDLILLGSGNGEGGQQLAARPRSAGNNDWEKSPPVQTAGQHYGGGGSNSQEITDDDVPF